TNTSEYRPCIVGLATARSSGESIAPRHKHAASPPVSECRKWEIAKGFLDSCDQRDVSTPRTGSKFTEVFALLVLSQHRKQCAARRRYLPSDSFVVATDELRRSWFTSQRRSAFPRIPVGPARAVCELLADAVNAPQPNPHDLSSIGRAESNTAPASCRSQP